MKRKNVFKTVIMPIAMALTVALSGCSGDKTGDKTEDTTTVKVEEAEPVYGGTAVFGMQQDLDGLDPHLATSAGTEEVLFNIFEGLVKADENGEMQCAVAQEYNISEDGITYTFTLRSGVKFHNGEEVTAEDVKYSLDRCAGKNGGEALVSAYSIIDSINIVDDSTVEVVLSEPNTELIGYMTTAIIPADYEDQANNPIGTGPFKFVSYTPQEGLVVEKNEDYWQEGVPYLDKVEFKVVASAETAMMALKAGTIDIYPYLTDDQVNELSADYNIEEGTSNLVQALFLNNDVEPFNNVKVRQALSYAISSQDIMDIVAGGRGYAIGTNAFPSFGLYYNEETETVYDYDVEKAKELLAEAGYEDGFDMTITVPSNYQFHVDTAQVIVEELKEIGVNAEIELVEWSSWLSDVYKGREYQSTIVGLDAELAPSALVKRFNSEASNNFVNYSNPEFDTTLAEAMATVDQDEKVTLYKELQMMLTEDAASVYIQDPAKLVAVNKELGGYTFYPVYVQDMSKIYFTTEQ